MKNNFNPITLLLWRSVNRMPQLELWSKLDIRQPQRIDLWEWLIVLLPFGFTCALCWLVSDFSNALLLIFIQSLGLGIIPAVGICAAINDFHRRGYYDIMSLSPRGSIGSSWMMAVRYIRHSSVFFLVNYAALIVQIMMGIAVVIGLFVGVEGLFRLINRQPESVDDLLTVFNGMLLLLMLRLDYIYSILTGMLIGILVPTATRRRLDATVMALGLFLVLQFALYGIFSSGAIVLAGLLIQNNGLLLSLVRVGIYIALREGVVMFLWHITTIRLNTDIQEFERLEQF